MRLETKEKKTNSSIRNKLSTFLQTLGLFSLISCGYTEVNHNTYISSNKDDYIGSQICVGSNGEGIDYEITDKYDHLSYKNTTSGVRNLLKCALFKEGVFNIYFKEGEGEDSRIINSTTFNAPAGETTEIILHN